MSSLAATVSCVLWWQPDLLAWCSTLLIHVCATGLGCCSAAVVKGVGTVHAWHIYVKFQCLHPLQSSHLLQSCSLPRHGNVVVVGLFTVQIRATCWRLVLQLLVLCQHSAYLPGGGAHPCACLCARHLAFNGVAWCTTRAHAGVRSSSTATCYCRQISTTALACLHVYCSHAFGQAASPALWVRDNQQHCSLPGVFGASQTVWWCGSL